MTFVTAMCEKDGQWELAMNPRELSLVLCDDLGRVHAGASAWIALLDICATLPEFVWLILRYHLLKEAFSVYHMK